MQAVGARPVATLDYSAYIDQFIPTQQKFIDGLSTVGVFLEVNREAVVAAAPDLIVGDAYEIDEDMFRELSKIAPTAVYSGTNRSDWRAVAEGVADAVNKGSALTSNRGVSAFSIASNSAARACEYVVSTSRPAICQPLPMGLIENFWLPAVCMPPL